MLGAMEQKVWTPASAPEVKEGFPEEVAPGLWPLELDWKNCLLLGGDCI